MDKLQRILHQAHLRYQQQQQVNDQAKPKIAYDKPLSAHEKDQITPEQYINGYYRLHCIHRKPLWMECRSQTCRRDSKEAKNNFVKLCNGRL